LRKFSLKGNKVYFDEIFYIDLNKNTIAEFDLKNKEYLTDEEYETLIRLRALSMGYFLLSKQDYSIKELKTKLLLKYREKHIIDEIIEEFRGKNYLDDYEYGRSYVRNHNYGKKKMEFMLFQKGLSQTVIKEVIGENSANELEEIKKLWIKLGDKEKEKKILSLMRKGFEYQDIKKAVSELE
jgi:regulatory protein